MNLIKDFMVSPVISVDAQTTVEAASKLMCGKKISSLLVKDGEEYVGIVTKTDIVNKLVAEGRDPKATKVDFLMSKPLLSMDQYIPRSEANEYMLRKKIKHLAVSQGKNILGILTVKDIVS